MKYAAFKNDEFLFDLHAESEAEALAKAKSGSPEVTSVKLISENDGVRDQ